MMWICRVASSARFAGLLLDCRRLGSALPRLARLAMPLLHSYSSEAFHPEEELGCCSHLGSEAGVAAYGQP